MNNWDEELQNQGVTHCHIDGNFRRNTSELFDSCEAFQAYANPRKHQPFTLIVNSGAGLPPTIVLVRDVKHLKNYPDDTIVMMQWQGKWSSDSFWFTVKEYCKHFKIERVREISS